MKLAVLVLLCGAVVPTQQKSLANLDFQAGPQQGWVGSGFELRPGQQSLRWVSSHDGHAPNGKAMLRYVFVVPPNTSRIVFNAHAVCADGCAPDKRLNVLLLGANHRQIEKLRHEDKGWVVANDLLPAAAGVSLTYGWDLKGEIGETLQIVLLDQDPRPGCYVVCSGFRVERTAEVKQPPPLAQDVQKLPQQSKVQQQQFAQDVRKLQQQHKLTPLVKYDSRHFTAWSNADPDFTVQRLRNCEVLYNAFTLHFERRGFPVRPTSTRLMVALFDSQTGFEAYLGRKMPSNLVGIYHPPTNRLVIYDINHNHGVLATKEKALKAGDKIGLDLDRIQYVQAVERWARDVCADANIATTMHEAAHQVSFNCGLLNRQGDVPLWLAEGLACYCEATDKGVWQGIGQLNPERLRVLAQVQKAKVPLLPLATLVGAADWRKDSNTLLLGYAQSWALFHMLMHQRPKALQSYLQLIQQRKTPDHRLTDFRQVFGADLARLDRELADYVRGLVGKRS